MWLETFILLVQDKAKETQVWEGKLARDISAGSKEELLAHSLDDTYTGTIFRCVFHYFIFTLMATKTLLTNSPRETNWNAINDLKILVYSV